MKRRTNSSLYVPKKCDLQTHKLFDLENECKNTQRFDVVKYQKLDDINETMLSFYWRPQEISFNKDKTDYENNSDFYERFILSEQLKKLVMLDSLQGRSPFHTFGQLTTNPEFENACLTWTFFEGAIHSRSYSHNIQSVYPDPSIIFDETFDNKILMKHTKTVIREYNLLYPEVIKYQNKENLDVHDFKTKILLSMVSVNILEGIRFYSGFSAIWGLTEFRNIFPGSTKVLQMIARDENVHMALTQFVLNKFRKESEEGFVEIFKEQEQKIYDMYFEAAEEEFEWIDYLYQHGNPLGINQYLAKEYIKYLTNIRLKAIGLKTIYPNASKNPIPWVNKYLNLGSSEGALQESENVDYASGSILMEDIDFKNILD